MRKLVAYLFYSVDGVAEAPDKWVQTFDEDMGEEISAVIAEQDDVLLGRVTYQEWAAYWPTATDEPFRSFINNVRKHVVSTSLDQVDWQNATLLKGDLREAVAKLKAAPGKTIGVHGSIKLVRSLVRERLLDELTLVMVPVIAGSGRGVKRRRIDQDFPMVRTGGERPGLKRLQSSRVSRPSPGPDRHR